MRVDLLCLARRTSLTVTAKNSSNPPPKPIRSQSTISHQPREFLLCLMQISHVLPLFFSFHYLDSAKWHTILIISYYLLSAPRKLRTHINVNDDRNRFRADDTYLNKDLFCLPVLVRQGNFLQFCDLKAAILFFFLSMPCLVYYQRKFSHKAFDCKSFIFLFHSLAVVRVFLFFDVMLSWPTCQTSLDWSQNRSTAGICLRLGRLAFIRKQINIALFTVL